MTAEPLQPRGAVPTHIPDHLKGKVWDFRNEPDGNISFEHPEASIGPVGRVTMTPEEYKLNFDRGYRLSDPARAISEGYAPMHRRPKTFGQSMSETIAGGVNKALDWGTSSQGKAVGTAGLLSALVGGVGGYMWGNNTGESPIRKALMMALLGGGIGAAGTAWAQGKHNRRENFLKSANTAEINSLIVGMLNRDPAINTAQRAMLMQALSRASNRDSEDLYRLLKTTAGAGVGVLAMRFLGAKGLLPAIFGGILGGMIGSSYGNEPKRNPLGQTLLDYMQ